MLSHMSTLESIIAYSALFVVLCFTMPVLFKVLAAIVSFIWKASQLIFVLILLGGTVALCYPMLHDILSLLKH
jgi:hypothetical protein